jgi:uncharacterized membrane protein YdjX (TVP38/TMEM64 family)
LALAGLALVIGVFLVGKYTDFVNLEALEVALQEFAQGPWGGPALILTFVGGALIGVPQFALIGLGVIAFGPLQGALWSWSANMVSGAVTFFIGRFAGQGIIARFSGPRAKAFTTFIARNAFAASAVVRNVPAGPFLIVNMGFGAVKARYLDFAAGMALGIIPKIALIAFGLQAVQAALKGHVWLAVGAGLAALGLFAGGWVYVRRRRRKGENIALIGAEPVDSTK